MAKGSCPLADPSQDVLQRLSPPPLPRPPPDRPALARPRLLDIEGRERDGCWKALERLGARAVGVLFTLGREIAGVDRVGSMAAGALSFRRRITALGPTGSSFN